MRKAFTLIELLVVIAIIAILAAILFPVFAQAKLAAKKAATISQAKQVGTALTIYLADYDDLFPCGTVPNLTTGGWRSFDFTAQSPAGWFAYPGAQEEYELMWHNVSEPYRKNYDILNPPGNNSVNITWPVATTPQLKAPKGSNLTYNGHLQHYSNTAIEAVSKLPLLWQGTGNQTNVGAAMANPRLLCTQVGPCVFNPSGYPQAGMAGGRGDVFNIYLNGPSYTPFGKSNVYVFADTSSKPINFGRGNQAPFPASTNSLVPLQFLDDSGKCTANFIRGRFAGGTVLYVAAFMPDNTFAN